MPHIFPYWYTITALGLSSIGAARDTESFSLPLVDSPTFVLMFLSSGFG